MVTEENWQQNASELGDMCSAAVSEGSVRFFACAAWVSHIGEINSEGKCGVSLEGIRFLGGECQLEKVSGLKASMWGAMVTFG